MKTFPLKTSANRNPTPLRRRISAINTILRSDIRSVVIEVPLTSAEATAVTIAERIVAAIVKPGKSDVVALGQCQQALPAERVGVLGNRAMRRNCSLKYS